MLLGKEDSQALQTGEMPTFILTNLETHLWSPGFVFVVRKKDQLMGTYCGKVSNLNTLFRKEMKVKTYEGLMMVIVSLTSVGADSVLLQSGSWGPCLF